MDTARFTYDELISNFGEGGGPPSNDKNSTYTAVCKALQEYERITPGSKVYFLEAAARTKLADLQQKIDVYNRSPHKVSIFGNQQKKNKERAAVTHLAESLKYHYKLSYFSEVVMQGILGGQPLIANSMTGWKRLLTNGTFTLSFRAPAGTNASVSIDKKLMLDAETYKKGGVIKHMQAFLVHEYHHTLVKGVTPRSKYLDEFVAHWKQYDVMGVRTNLVERVTLLNTWLLDDPAGYKCRTEIKPGFPVVTRIEDCGAYWTSHMVNEGG